MITNSNDHYLSFGELLHEAEEERMTFTPDRMLTFGIPILDKYTLGIFPHDLVVIGADTWVGKAQPLDSLVCVPHWREKMGNIKVWHTIIWKDGTHKKVIGIPYEWKQETYKLVFSDWSSCEASENHLFQVNWFVCHKNYTQDLTVKEIIAWKRLW